jgi:hypothetical protein
LHNNAIVTTQILLDAVRDRKNIPMKAPLNYYSADK